MYQSNLQNFKQTSQYKTLVASGANCFISVRMAHGKLSQRILQELPIEDFFKEITNIDKSGTEVVTSEDLMHFTVDVELMLQHFTDNIIKLFHTSNNQLFNKFIKYDQDGTFRAFASDYNKIMSDPNYKNEHLMMGIHRSCGHYLNEFMIMPDFKYDKHLEKLYDQKTNRHYFPIDIIAVNFAMLINVLCMNIMYEYYTDRECFSNEDFLKQQIDSIRSHLMTLFDEPKTNIQNSRNPSGDAVDLYRVNLAFNNPDKLDEFEQITGVEISRKVLVEYMKPYMQKDSASHYLSPDVCIFDFNLDEKSCYYFDTLADLLNKLNHIESVYVKLKQLSQVKSDEDQASALFHLYLKKPLSSNNLGMKKL